MVRVRARAAAPALFCLGEADAVFFLGVFRLGEAVFRLGDAFCFLGDGLPLPPPFLAWSRSRYSRARRIASARRSALLLALVPLALVASAALLAVLALALAVLLLLASAALRFLLAGVVRVVLAMIGISMLSLLENGPSLHWTLLVGPNPGRANWIGLDWTGLEFDAGPRFNSIQSMRHRLPDVPRENESDPDQRRHE